MSDEDDLYPVLTLKGRCIAQAATKAKPRKDRTSAERNKRHRERHGDAYREKRRLYMKKWRAR